MRTFSFIQIILCLTTAWVTSCSRNSTIEIGSFPAEMKINGVDVEFSGYKREYGNLTITICFDPPSKEQWVFDDVVFKINDQKISPTWVSSNSETGRVDGFSCGGLSYPINEIPNKGRAELLIGQMRADTHEYDCDKTQKKLDETKTGIVVMCGLGTLGIGNSSGIGILEKPQTMSDDEAYNLVVDAFSEVIQIDWKFSFLVEKP